jgi:truncated hemoglobin YjbI
MSTQNQPSLYERLGGVYSIATVVDDFYRPHHGRSAPECKPRGR